MTTIGENLRAKLLSDPELTKIVGHRVHQNHVPQRPGDSYIYFATDSTGESDDLNGIAGELPLSTSFVVECISHAADGQRIAEAIKSRVRALNKYRGAFGSTTAKGVFVTDYQDQYEPRGLGADIGAAYTVCQVQVFT